MKRIALTALLLGSAGLWSTPALALLNIGSCTITSSGVSFGQYDPNNNDDLAATGTINFKCSSLLNVGASGAFHVYLGAGNGSFTQREMKKGSNILNYNLYTDSSYTTVWGDGTAGTGFQSGFFQFPLVGLLTYREADFTIVGRVTKGQFVSDGIYTDIITVTVIN